MNCLQTLGLKLALLSLLIGSAAVAASIPAKGHPILKSQDEIRFGLVACQSGDLRPWAEDEIKGVQLAIDAFNTAGGVGGRKVKLIIADSKSHPEDAQIVAQKLVTEDKVVLLLGEIASGLTKQMAEAAADTKIPILAVGATRDNLNYENPNLFRVCYTDSQQALAMAKFAYRHLKLRKIALVTDKIQPFSVGLSEGFRTAFTDLGGEIISEQFYQTGDTLFPDQTARLKRYKPQAIFLSGYFNEVGPFVRQAREVGVKATMLGSDGWDSSEILATGGDAILGSYFCNHYNNHDPRPVVTNFLTKWQMAYGGDVPTTAMGALGYDAAMLACKALLRAKTKDAAGLKRAIANTVGYPGVTGRITLKGNAGNPPKRIVIVKLTKLGQVYVTAEGP